LKSLKKIEVGLTKEQRQQDEMICIGGKGKKKQNRTKKVVEKTNNVEDEDNQYEEPFHHDISLIQKCTTIGVSPPEIPAQLEEKIEEVQKKMTDYESAGKDEQEKQILDKEKNIESYIKKQEDSLAFEMKMAREQGQNNRTDRGGKGRGARGRGGVQRDNN